MKPTDTISVLVCVHSTNRHHDDMFDRALNSLAEQTFRDFQTVIVLDECGDAARSVASNYRSSLNPVVCHRDKKQGLAYAKNFGIEQCTGDWICYLDADDSWMQCKLEIQRNYMIANPEIDFCGTESWDRDQYGILRPNCFAVGQYETHLDIVKQLPRENVMCHGSMMIRREALRRLNGYNTDREVLGREDWDLWVRAVNNNYIFGKVPERLYVWSAGTSVAR